MIEVVIDKVRYPVASEWCEIGIGTLVALSEVLDGASAEVRGYFSPLFVPSAAAGALSDARRRELYAVERRMLALLARAVRRGEGQGFEFGTAEDDAAGRLSVAGGGRAGRCCGREAAGAVGKAGPAERSAAAGSGGCGPDESQAAPGSLGGRAAGRMDRVSEPQAGSLSGAGLPAAGVSAVAGAPSQAGLLSGAECGAGESRQKEACGDPDGRQGPRAVEAWGTVPPSKIGPSQKTGQPWENENLAEAGLPAAGLSRDSERLPDALSAEETDELFKRWLWHIPVSLLHEPVYEPVGMTWFRWRGERLRLPRTGRDLAGVRMPLESASAEEFCTASDLLTLSGWRLAPALVATLCRSEGEPFGEESVKRRAAAFAGLPVSVFFEVMFLLLATHFYMRREFPACYAGEAAGRTDAVPEERRVALSWSQMPLLLCGCRPDRVRRVARTGCYDFMAALHLFLQLR